MRLYRHKECKECDFLQSWLDDICAEYDILVLEDEPGVSAVKTEKKLAVLIEGKDVIVGEENIKKFLESYGLRKARLQGLNDNKE